MSRPAHTPPSTILCSLTPIVAALLAGCSSDSGEPAAFDAMNDVTSDTIDDTPTDSVPENDSTSTDEDTDGFVTDTDDASVDGPIDDTATDSEGSADAAADATQDADVDASGQADSGAAACPTWPREINAELYGAPARCGQAPFEWVDDDRLGEIIDTIDSTFFAAALLDSVITSQGVTLPFPLLYDARVEQITYLTQDRGELVEATGLVAWPAGLPDDSAPLQMVLLLHGTTGFSDGCGPAGELEWRALAGLFASLGFGVVSPDYVGLRTDGESTGFLHPYLVHQPTAMSALDMLRAFPRIDGAPCMSNEILAFGGSQGGHAALWVDRMLPYYASEFELLGTIATVPPMDLVGQVELALTEVRNSTGNTIAFFATAPFWYGVGEQLDQLFVAPFDTAIPDALSAGCRPGSALDEPETLADLFVSDVLNAVQSGAFDDIAPWFCVTADSSLVDTAVARINEDSDSYGILVITGGRDNLVDTPNERAAFETLCDAGQPMEYLECQNSSHGGATFDALNDILTFALARAAREPWTAPSTCDAPPAVECARD